MQDDHSDTDKQVQNKPADIEALAWSIQLVSTKLDSEITACKARADDAVSGEVKLESIRRNLQGR